MAGMTGTIVPHFNIYRYTLTQALYIVNGIRLRCTDPRALSIIPLCEAAVEQARQAREAQAPPEEPVEEPAVRSLATLDDEADRLTTSIYRRVADEAVSKTPGARAEEAARFLNAYFSEGLRGHVQLSYREKSQENLELAIATTRPPWREMIDRLGLRETADQLEAVGREFYDQVLFPPVAPSRQTWRSTMNGVNDAVALVICAVVAAFGLGDAASIAERDRVLQPYTDLNRQIHERLVEKRPSRKDPTCSPMAGTAPADTAPTPAPSDTAPTPAAAGA